VTHHPRAQPWDHPGAEARRRREIADLRLIVLFVCERGLAVRPRALECRWVPLSCGYAPGRIDL
jgi:hypothetical protein